MKSNRKDPQAVLVRLACEMQDVEDTNKCKRLAALRGAHKGAFCRAAAWSVLVRHDA